MVDCGRPTGERRRVTASNRKREPRNRSDWLHARRLVLSIESAGETVPFPYHLLLRLTAGHLTSRERRTRRRLQSSHNCSSVSQDGRHQSDPQSLCLRSSTFPPASTRPIHLRCHRDERRLLLRVLPCPRALQATVDLHLCKGLSHPPGLIKADQPLQLLTASSLTILALFVSSALYHFRSLPPTYNLINNAALSILWILALSFLTGNVGWTIGHRCTITTWLTNAGIVVCRLFKACTAFTVTGLYVRNSFLAFYRNELTKYLQARLPPRPLSRRPNPPQLHSTGPVQRNARTRREKFHPRDI